MWKDLIEEFKKMYDEDEIEKMSNEEIARKLYMLSQRPHIQRKLQEARFLRIAKQIKKGVQK